MYSSNFHDAPQSPCFNQSGDDKSINCALSDPEQTQHQILIHWDPGACGVQHPSDPWKIKEYLRPKCCAPSARAFTRCMEKITFSCTESFCMLFFSFAVQNQQFSCQKNTALCRQQMCYCHALNSCSPGESRSHQSVLHSVVSVFTHMQKR